MFFNAERLRVEDWDGKARSACPLCGLRLMAKKGDVVRWHWAHFPDVEQRGECAHTESAWHLRWKDVYASFDGWDIEVPISVSGKRYVADAMNQKTRRIREFVHSLSPAYVEKHEALKRSEYQVLWIFDGMSFWSERCIGVGRQGLKHLLKPRAWEVARSLDALVHYVEIATPALWKHWRDNIWFPARGEVATELLTRYALHVQQGASALQKIAPAAPLFPAPPLDDGSLTAPWPDGVTPDGRQVAYPLCCGQKTRLSVFGWHCPTCDTYHDFAYTPVPTPTQGAMP